MDDSTQGSNQDRVVHEVDGIQEYDNHLPNWWLYTLYGTIVFAAVYWFYYHVFQTGEPPDKVYRREMAALAERLGKSLPLTADGLRDLATDAKVTREGLGVYTTNCVPCHGATGGGNIGPNLTDDHWLHGGDPEAIFKSIRDGYPTKGMLAWGAQLGDKRVQAVTAYVLTLRNANVAGGKAPQGEKYSGK